MDAFLAVVVVALSGLLPLLAAAGFASMAKRWLDADRFPAGRWNVLPLFLIGFALTAILIVMVTLTFRPGNKPRLLNPVLVLLVVDWLLLIPAAAFAAVRGVWLIRSRRSEAGLNLAAASAVGLLYLPLGALEDYYPHV